jgi:hypothetical protein
MFVNAMGTDNEHIVGFFVLLILLLQSLCFNIELPHFSSFLLNVIVATNIKEIIIMSIYLCPKITCSLGLLPTELAH